MAFDNSDFIPDDNQKFDNSDFVPESKDPLRPAIYQIAKQLAPQAKRKLTDVLGGVSDFRNGLVNFPGHLSNTLFGTKVPEYNPSDEYGANFHVENPDISDDLVRGAARYAPYTAAGGLLGLTGILGQGLEGTAYGLTQSKNPIQGATISGLTNALTAGASNVIGRAGQTIFKNAKKLSAEEGSAYNAIKDEADAAGFRADAKPYTDYLKEKLNSIKEKSSLGSLSAVKSDVKTLYNEAVNGPTSTKPDLFSVENIHDQMQGLNNKISDAFKSGKSKIAKEYIGIKEKLQESLLSSLRKNNLGHLADRFQATQKNWAENVAPLKQYPVLGRDVAKQMGVLAAISHLPTPIGEFAAVSAGIRDSNVFKNSAKRYGSSVAGGPRSILTNDPNRNRYLSTALQSILSNAQNQGANQ